MVFINDAVKEVTLKLVYYGPGLSGKTTNLEYIHSAPDVGNKGKMLSMATETDRTIFFDFMPMDLGKAGEYKIRTQLYTVPGQVFYDATRRLVLRGADGVIFVADSQREMMQSNLESLKNLKDNLVINGIDPDKIPIILQYNKRDLPNTLGLAELDSILNPKGFPTYEAVAVRGDGVIDTFREALKRIIHNLNHRVDIMLKEIPQAPAAAEESPQPVRQDPLDMLKSFYHHNENMLKLLASIMEEIKQQQEYLGDYLHGDGSQINEK